MFYIGFFVKKMRDLLIYLVSDVSKLLRSLTKNERCKRIAQVAYQKWATISDLLRSFTKNERPWANRSGCSPKISKWANHLLWKRMSEFPALPYSVSVPPPILSQYLPLFCLSTSPYSVSVPLLILSQYLPYSVSVPPPILSQYLSLLCLGTSTQSVYSHSINNTINKV